MGSEMCIRDRLIKRSQNFVIDSKHTLNVLSLLSKIYSPIYVHSVLTAVPLLRSLTMIGPVLHNSNFEVFWRTILFTGFNILIDESVSSNTSVRIIKINLSIIDAFYPLSVTDWLSSILMKLSVSILTPAEKKEYVERIAYLKENKQQLSFDDEHICLLYTSPSPRDS